MEPIWSVTGYLTYFSSVYSSSLKYESLSTPYFISQSPWFLMAILFHIAGLLLPKLNLMNLEVNRFN